MLWKLSSSNSFAKRIGRIWMNQLSHVDEYLAARHICHIFHHFEFDSKRKETRRGGSSSLSQCSSNVMREKPFLFAALTNSEMWCVYVCILTVPVLPPTTAPFCWYCRKGWYSQIKNFPFSFKILKASAKTKSMN